MKKNLLSSDISKLIPLHLIFSHFIFFQTITYLCVCGGMQRERGVVRRRYREGRGFFSLDYLVVVRSYGFHK